MKEYNEYFVNWEFIWSLIKFKLLNPKRAAGVIFKIHNYKRASS